MSLQTFPCPNGEICYAEECTQARQCMHQGEATHYEQLTNASPDERTPDTAPAPNVTDAVCPACGREQGDPYESVPGRSTDPLLCKHVSTISCVLDDNNKPAGWVCDDCDHVMLVQEAPRVGMATKPPDQPPVSASKLRFYAERLELVYSQQPQYGFLDDWADELRKLAAWLERRHES